ncbi:MAG: site-specific integrase [Nanoarchaeota archaeon]|nr:site-specific integrase [Nanoarchaeota archaeon]
MAQDDIYNSKRQYDTVVEKINSGVYLEPYKSGKYVIRNKVNVEYFKKLITEFEYKDTSYIRRIQFFKALRKTCALTDKDLSSLTREDIKEMVAKLNKVHKTINSRRDFVNYNKAIWKSLFPEKDAKDRPDDTIVPYAWRIKVNADPSLQTDKKDKLTDTEYTRIQRVLSKDPRMQLYFSLMFECLARPQELCYLNLENIQMFDNYARIRVGEHGKEGTKTLQVVDSYFYLAEWLNHHPLQGKKGKIPLFITQGNNSKFERLSPKHANKILHRTLTTLGIDKPITNYSFKRNGVTSRFVSGEPAQNIQKIAGWTSTNQLKTYDLSDQEAFLEEELIRKGVMKEQDRGKKRVISYRQCAFCNTINPKSRELCGSCKRPLDRDTVLNAEREKESMLRNQLKEQEKQMAEMAVKFNQINEFMNAVTKGNPKLLKEIAAQKENSKST